ncbi:hypothetical protein PIB30_102310 [Stylosanthes scabra]|uniref:Ribonuclease H1 N-terminal domain-containing protein n=1 Tax=Stylosanthes scabra TaxID=79078 RepID=A0ABU6ZW93_9FABA|nr:hypothetical protein [Stylosanthes scabra]
MEGKYSHYAVRAGKVPSIYTSWEEDELQVLGFSLDKFKGFLKISSRPCTPNAETGYWVAGGGLTLIGLSGSGNVDYVPETQLGDFLIAEDIKLSLVRACMKLSMGCPMFEGKEFYLQYGVRMFYFSAALRCKERGVNLEVEGCVCAAQSRAREDAAHKLLDMLWRHTGNSIMDFNYRRFCAAQQHVQELQEVHDREVVESVRELEAQCGALWKEIENY